jgi:hypothetical protein
MTTSRKLTGTLTTVLCLMAVFAIAGEETTATTTQQAPCCFENPRFSGTCEVTPGPEESCGNVLGYLNNPNSMGKDYCGNTTIRGGWTQVECEGAVSVVDQCSVDRTTSEE